jgi:uncharacterized membrane protein YgcG
LAGWIALRFERHGGPRFSLRYACDDRPDMTSRSLPLVAAAVLACSTAAASAPAAPLAPAAFALVPARPGTSTIYGYQVDANGPRGSQYLHGVVVITRLATGRAVVTVAPEAGAATAVILAAGTDGTLRAAPPAPGDALGRALPVPIPPGMRALSALLAAPAAGATWPLAVEAGDAVVPATLSLTAHVAQHDGERTVSADGTGTITLAQQQQPAEQRGGNSRGGGGGRGGGLPGGGFPGGGGMGGGRRGGGGDDAGTPQRVPATEVLHVEVSFRGATFLGARGTEQTTPTQGDKTPSSASWSLFPF